MSDMTGQLLARQAAVEKDLADLRDRVVGMVPASIAPTSGGLEAQVAAIQSSVAALFVSMPQVAAGASREVDDGELVIDPVVFLTLAVTSATETAGTGDATTKCSYTYDVEDALTGYKYFGDGTSPEVAALVPTDSPHHWVRPEVGYLVAATFGYGHVDNDGNLNVDWINEIAQQEACDGDEDEIDQGTW